eukprot:3148620-Pleurochrysis_carterae.AAC.3
MSRKEWAEFEYLTFEARSNEACFPSIHPRPGKHVRIHGARHGRGQRAVFIHGLFADVFGQEELPQPAEPTL